ASYYEVATHELTHFTPRRAVPAETLAERVADSIHNLLGTAGARLVHGLDPLVLGPRGRRLEELWGAGGGLAGTVESLSRAASGERLGALLGLRREGEGGLPGLGLL